MNKKKLREIITFVKREMKKSKDPTHEWEHVKRVAENCQTIIKLLHIKNDVDSNLLQAICFLHDINRAYYPPGIFNYFFETHNSKKVLPKILSELGVKKLEKHIIENAIYSSSFSFPFRKLNKNRDLYTQILQDADTIDFFNGDRVKKYKKHKNEYLFFRFLSPFSETAINYGRKNLKIFLNFPQIASKFYVQKN